jgi:hypothetical protein
MAMRLVQFHLTGTGLTHLGSAETRDRMHQPAAGEQVTDSLRMFQLGLEGGKPAGACAQPEWFYKGDGACIAAPGQMLASPSFALDGGEEPEIAGVYLIDFKYALFPRPGDVHVHCFGTATLSFADGIQAREGDVFEISASPFRIPLQNTFGRCQAPAVEVRPL